MVNLGRTMNVEPVIREIVPSDLPEWVRMRSALWPDAPLSELEVDCRDYLSGARRTALPQVVFVIDRGAGPGGPLGGFQEVSVRGAVEGCSTSTVAYLEGILVERNLRRQGWARRLVEAAENWARAQKCAEIASDVLAGNHTSHRVHLRLGFGHARPLIVLRKRLGPVTAENVHATLVAEPIDTAAAVYLVQDPYAPALRMAAGVVAHHRRGDGRELLATEATETPETPARLREMAGHFHEQRGLTKLAVILRAGRIPVGECWGAVAVSAATALIARDAAEDFLALLAGDEPMQRCASWRSAAYTM